MGLLDQIVAHKKEEVLARSGAVRRRELRARIADAPPPRGFSAALSSGATTPRLIAEVKKASPSAGIIRADFDPVQIAQIYADRGASALSVLTESHFFLGHPDHLAAVRARVTLPILQKDFIVDDLQIDEARVLGADACLLIAALLTAQQLRDYFHLARALSLDVLVEVHDEGEMESVAEWAPLIGINNRDLATFTTDLSTTIRLLSRIPPDLRVGRLFVSESGIRSRADIERLQAARVDAVLIGESLMAAGDIAGKMTEMFRDDLRLSAGLGNTPRA